MKQNYINYISQVVDANLEKNQTRIESIINNGANEYHNVDGLIAIITMDLTLYEIDNLALRLNRCHDLMTKILALYTMYIKNKAVLVRPILNRMFGIPSFCKIMIKLKKYQAVTKWDLDTAYKLLVDIGAWTVNYPEWGTHNRATARATAMYWAYKLFPNKKQSPIWLRTFKALIADSLGKWSIEDAATYHPIWIADIMEMEYEDIKAFPNHDLVIQHYLNMLCYIQNPLFIVTEYGDGRLGTQWGHIINILEQGATRYQNGVYKYVARRIFKKMSSLDDLQGFAVGQSKSIAFAIPHVDDGVAEVEPYMGSLEAMDDLVTKKIVLKNGLCDKSSTFMFYNYKDVTENGVLGRRNLDETIVAPAEKNHHGHTDENSICLLTYKDSILLKDGGYREKIDLKGAFRSDLYHNKLVIRNGQFANLSEALFIEQYYNKVKSEKLYFYEFNDADCLRTRVYDFKHNAIHDRAISYLKNENIFIIIDSIKATKSGKYLFSNQYFSQKIDSLREGLYQTNYQFIASDELKPGFNNNENNKLLIYYPLRHGTYHIEDLRRAYTTETILSEYNQLSLKKNDFYATCTILIPNEDQIDYQLIDSIRVRQDEKGLSVSLTVNENHYEISHKFDEFLGFNEKRRPMYQFNKSKVVYQDLESDALFTIIKENKSAISYAFVAGSKVLYKGSSIFAISKKSDFFQPNISTKLHIGSYPNYQEIIKK